MEPRNTNAPSLRGPVLMAYGRSKQEKLRLCCGQHVHLNDCNSNVVKMFQEYAYSHSYVLATQVFTAAALEQGKCAAKSVESSGDLVRQLSGLFVMDSGFYC